MDRLCYKSAIVFATQMVVVLTVVTAAIINLSLKNENKEMWISLLCSTIGYVMPAPKLRKLTTTETETSNEQQ